VYHFDRFTFREMGVGDSGRSHFSGVELGALGRGIGEGAGLDRCPLLEHLVKL
jgi:hypothetical protein